MALDFGNNTGTIFSTLGKIAAVIKNQDSNVATQNTAMSSQVAGIVGQLNSEPDVQAIMGGSYLGVLSSISGAAGSSMRSVAEAVVNRLVYRDSPRQGQTLTSVNTLACLQEVIRQMKEQGATVLAMTVAATPTTFSGTGDGVLNVSVKRPFDGLVLENSFAETLTVICTSDSYVSGATEGNEGMLVNGIGVQQDVFAFDWPRGSGTGSSVRCIDGSQNASSGNLLTNSGWDAFTGNVPDDWGVVTGTAGTHFRQNTGFTYDGSSALELVGNGTTLVRLRQLFGTDTSETLLPLAQYSFCGWAARDGVAPTGTLRISLKDSNGAILKDANNVDNTITLDLSTLTTTWAPFKGVFRTPLAIPSSYYMEVETTTALSSGRSVYLDRFGLGGMTQMYVSGPFLAVHSGAIPFRIGDRATVAITNSRGAAGTLSTWQTVFSRLYVQAYQNELLLPSSSSPSILDSWIQ